MLRVSRMTCVVCSVVLCVLMVSVASAVVMETVPVGNPGNAPDTRHDTPGYGAVDYHYNIGKYEVTAGQYTDFLNAVAATDPYGLYNTNMPNPLPTGHGMDITNGGCTIQRSGTPGNYTYSVLSDWLNRPVNYVSWGDSARFVNWLHNGQPTGAQDLSTTEDGAYAMVVTQSYYNSDGSVNDYAGLDGALQTLTRKADWKWAIPTEDEWYKAAYHKNDGVTGNYYEFPTSSDSPPGRSMNETTNPGNNANTLYSGGSYPILPGQYTTVVGEFELSESPYGTFDQCGNLWETNEAMPLPTTRGYRSGSYGDSYPWGISGRAGYRAEGRVPTREYWSNGFRVVEAQVPEPASITLLVLGSIGMMIKRRRFRA